MTDHDETIWVVPLIVRGKLTLRVQAETRAQAESSARFVAAEGLTEDALRDGDIFVEAVGPAYRVASPLPETEEPLEYEP